MINLYYVNVTEEQIENMIKSVLDFNLQEPLGRINKTTGKKKDIGTQHTISVDDIRFSPLIESIHKIAKSNFTNYIITDIWTNYNPPGGINKRHHHVGADIAGCFYLVIPDNSGDIQFETGESIKPKPGNLFWWNGKLEHWVTKNESNCDRISIAFNIKRM
jgi:hypothetical protein